MEHAAKLMYYLRVKRLPVVDENGGWSGSISRADVLSVYDRPDDAIRQEITDKVILLGFLEDPRHFAVTVQAGVVTVQGSPGDRRARPRHRAERSATSRVWWRSTTS